MTRTLLVIGTILFAIVFEISIASYLSIADATISLVGIVTASLFLLGFLDLALQAAVIGGVLLDLVSPGPFGAHTIILSILWGFFFLASRYRLVAPRAVVVSVVMAATGIMMTIPDMLVSPGILLPIASALIHAVIGTVAFPIMKKLFPPVEVVWV